MGSSRFSPCRSCCECDYFADDFQRTELGPNWTKLSLTDGSVIYANTLRMPAGGEKTLLEVGPPPAWLLGLDLLNCRTGAKYRVICNYNEATPDVYDFAEVEIDGQHLAIVRLCHFNAGSISILAQGGDNNLGGVNGAAVLDGGTLHITVCWSNVWAVSGVTDAPVWTCRSQSGDSSSDRIVLWNGGTTDLRWDNLTVTKHKSVRANCPDCICSCGGHCISHELIATFVGCPQLDGQSFPLHIQSFSTWRPNAGEYPKGMIYNGYELPLEFFDFMCEGSWEVPDFAFAIDDPVGGCEGLSTATVTLVDYNCHPFSVTFEITYTASVNFCRVCEPHSGPWYPPGSQPNKTITFRLVVTEAP